MSVDISEIKEFPAPDELKVYFDKHWAEQGKMSEEFFAGIGVDGSKLLQKIYDSILASLNRLNKLRRTDEFWNNTNRKPTIYKLAEFSLLVREKNQDDDLAWWTLFSLAMFKGLYSFKRDDWKLFWQHHKSDAEILVLAEFVQDYFFGGDGSYLAEILNELGLVQVSRSKIEEITLSTNFEASKWAERVFELIGEK